MGDGVAPNLHAWLVAEFADFVNRYSVPFRFAGKTLLVRDPVAGGRGFLVPDVEGQPRVHVGFEG
jgi:hypothetical protein